MNGVTLADFVKIPGRFYRSVNVAKDWRRPEALADYIVTPTVRELARQVLAELQTSNGLRAWSITGPYGTGKSAFAIFLADSLTRAKPFHKDARELRIDAELASRPLVPALLTAERGPLGPAILRATASALSEADPKFSRRLRGLAGRSPTGDRVVESVLQAASISRKKRRGGLLLIIDELGKFLEFAAGERQEDPYLLQQLAEAVARSEQPIVLLTILHRAFADYVPQGEELRQAEWQKVQGRFHDVPFQLPTEQLLGVVGHAIEAKPPAAIRRSWDRLLQGALATPALQEARTRLPASELLSSCLPLHPVAALLLWPVFRSKVAQNERSLFAFLTSCEPYSFSSFLYEPLYDAASPQLYRLPELFDYVSHSLGLSTFTGVDARRWALIDAALARVPASAPDSCREVVKAVGLLDLYGAQVGLQPSCEVLKVALDHLEDVVKAIDLLGEKSVLLFRRHRNAYTLWEGSDFDLDSAWDEGRRRLSSTDWHHRMASELRLQPVVARAHYIQRGTLRFFDVSVVPPTPEDLATILHKETTADGRVAFVLGNENDTDGGLLNLAKEITGEQDRWLDLIAVPEGSGKLQAAWESMEAWTWVRDNNPELAGDLVARQEVRARLAAARQEFEAIAGPIFGLVGQTFDPSKSVWVAGGEVHEINSAIEFQRWLSRLCSNFYDKAPELHNEILNRKTLSSAAAAARRTLIERMLTCPDEPRLGIEGHPAEATMYESMLAAGGFPSQAWSGSPLWSTPRYLGTRLGSSCRLHRASKGWPTAYYGAVRTSPRCAIWDERRPHSGPFRCGDDGKAR